MFMSYYENAGRSHISIANKFFDSVVKFKCLGMAFTNHSCIHEETDTNLGMLATMHFEIFMLFSAT